MKRFNSPALVTAVSIALTLVAAGCHDHVEDPIPPPGGGGPQPVAFDTFVIGLVQDQTADDIDPAQVNGVSFEFDEDEHAFDVLFQ